MRGETDRSIEPITGDGAAANPVVAARPIIKKSIFKLATPVSEFAASAFVVPTPVAQYCPMEHPTDSNEKRSSYWIRGPKTPRHSYFYPSDDRAGLALMLLFGILGLIAFGFGIKNIFGSPEIQRRDVILTGIGLITAAIGLYQANRLRHSRE
jgi:hypothetical protein